VMPTKGTSIIFAIFAVVVLSILGLVMFSLISSDSGSIASQILSARSFFAAESGWQIGAQAVKDDKSATFQAGDSSANGYYAYSYLEGGYNSNYGGSDAFEEDRACFHGQAIDNSTPRYNKNRTNKNECILDIVGNASVWVGNFQQRINLIGGTIANVEIVVRAAKHSGSDPTIQLEYSTDGGVNWIPAGVELTIDNDADSDWTVYRYADFETPMDWLDLMDSANFLIRARRTDEGGDCWCDIDWLALRVTVEVDALTEPWGSNSYITLPASMGNSTIESITVHDESGKINLNYSPEGLIEELFIYCGIESSAASTLAGNIVSYRGGDWFNTIEEVKAVSGMTDAYYDLVKDDITVYSWVNQNVENPIGSRAPININTASKNVLKAVFRTAITDESDIAQLADDVYDQARSDPFTHMFSYFGNQQYFDAQPNYSRCFSAFLESRSSYVRNKDMNKIRAVVDGSLYNKELKKHWEKANANGVEFCYYSHTFLIESIGKSGDVERAIAETYGFLYDYPTYTIGSTPIIALPTYVGESSPKPYWTEEQ